METVQTNAATLDGKIYIELDFEFYTPNYANAIRVESAAASAIRNFLQAINMPISKYRVEAQEESAGIYKTTIQAITDARNDFQDYTQTYAWRDMVHEKARLLFTKRQLKASLLANGFPNCCSYTLRKTGDSDISGCTIRL